MPNSGNIATARKAAEEAMLLNGTVCTLLDQALQMVDESSPAGSRQGALLRAIKSCVGGIGECLFDIDALAEQ